MHAKFSCIVVTLLLSAPARGEGNAFDPSGYLDDKAKADTIKAAELSSKGIIRLDGRRYHKFSSTEGSVYLPGAGETPDMLEDLALCDAHLKLFTEVLPVRENVAIDAATKKLETKLIALIRKCQGVRVDAPPVTIETPDGTVLEMKQKDKKKGKEQPTEAAKPLK